MLLFLPGRACWNHDAHIAKFRGLPPAGLTQYINLQTTSPITDILVGLATCDAYAPEANYLLNVLTTQWPESIHEVRSSTHSLARDWRPHGGVVATFSWRTHTLCIVPDKGESAVSAIVHELASIIHQHPLFTGGTHDHETTTTRVERLAAQHRKKGRSW